MAGLTTDINRVKYISEDFQTYRDEADAFYQTYYPSVFNDLINTDPGNALMDQLSFAMEALSFMLNRRASELFFKTARLNKSITKLAKMLGYPIAPAAPGTTDVTLTLTNGPYGFPIPIPVGFKLPGPGNIIYQYNGASPYVFAPGDMSGTLPFSEGIAATMSFISDGTQNQQFSIAAIPSGNNLYADGMSLFVDGIEWSRQGILSYQSLNFYEILFSESPPLLLFGDGIVGNIPPSGSQIVLNYVTGLGLQGSIGTNQLNSPTAPLVVNGQSIAMTVTNTIGNVGADPEDIRHVKAFASSFFRTQNAAVIKSDYDTLAQLQTGVAIADAETVRGVSGDVTIQANFGYLNAGVIYLSGALAGITSVAVSGTSHLGWNGVTGVGAAVTGMSYLGVSGLSSVSSQIASASGLFSSGVSGLNTYLSRVLSDTSQANNVQVVVLSVDANNKYITPSNDTLASVQNNLQILADAVVTVTAVDGSGWIVLADISIDIGISPTAIEADVVAAIKQAMTSSTLITLNDGTQSLGLMVRRKVSQNLYLTNINDMVRNYTQNGDVVFINPKITIVSGTGDSMDTDGDLIVATQRVIQARNVSINVIKRFSRGEVY